MASLALGNFDGVHIAHKAVLKNAAGYPEPVCLLFKKHPCEVLLGKSPAKILGKEQTEKKIYECGIKRIEYLDFEQIRDYSPEEFFEKILIEKFSASQISCGYNYTFGKNKAGTAKILKELCENAGVKLTVCAEVMYRGEPVSSTRIRKAVQSGEIEKANAMLGYPYFYEGEIVGGKRLGRELGFPTINQLFCESVLKPFAGVYASEVTIKGIKYKGLTNVGNNPTVEGDGFRSETYIFDFEGEVYGENAKTELLKFIRAEKKFNSVSELRAQVLSDIERVKEDV